MGVCSAQVPDWIPRVCSLRWQDRPALTINPLQRIDVYKRQGIHATVPKNILKYREEHGKFTTRRELLKVAKLGPKAYEQCAGFLRLPDSEMPLDRTGVHPESYAAAEGLLALRCV